MTLLVTQSLTAYWLKCYCKIHTTSFIQHAMDIPRYLAGIYSIHHKQHKIPVQYYTRKLCAIEIALYSRQHSIIVLIRVIKKVNVFCQDYYLYFPAGPINPFLAKSL